MSVRRPLLAACTALAAALALGACSGHSKGSDPSSAAAGSPSVPSASADVGGATVSAIAPATAPAPGGTRVVLTGTGLSGATAVTFGGRPALGVRVVSATSLVALAPPHAAGSAPVVVRGATGSSSPTPFTYQPSTTGIRWTQPLAPATDVSCASASFCVAVSGASASRWTGTTWTTPSPLPAPATVVSCDSPRHCLAVGTTAAAWNGTRWAPVPGARFRSPAVSCATASLCLVGSADGTVERLTGTRWTRVPAGLSGAVTGVSCGDEQMCAAVDAAGHISVIDAPGSPAPQVYPRPVARSGFAAVSCSSAVFCAATDRTGHAWYWDGNSWRVKGQVTGVAGAVVGVSCLAADFCKGVAAHGVYGWNGKRISTEDSTGLDLSADGPTLIDVSCGSRTFCVTLTR